MHILRADMVVSFYDVIVDGEGHKNIYGCTRSAARVILDAKHTTRRAINICWHTSVLLLRRGQNADVVCAAISLKLARIFLWYLSLAIRHRSLHASTSCLCYSLYTSACAVTAGKHNHKKP